jgi:hypothetical protein
MVWLALHRRLLGARALLINRAPILAWQSSELTPQIAHAPAHHPHPHFAR